MIKPIDNKKEVAIYVHWPFCKAKCPYCDFNSHVRAGVDHLAFAQAYMQEIEYFKTYLIDKKIISIFFGGGTPSLMPINLVEAIINKLNKISDFATNIEITLEANPSSVEINNFTQLKSIGVNRVSIGIQSFNSDKLKFLGRQHSNKEGIAAIEAAGNIFSRYSFDLIYALPNQTLAEWEQELNYALKLGSKHLSLYQLIIEKGTQFYSDYNKKLFVMPSDIISDEMFDITQQIMQDHGMPAYEISNHATIGHECKHNLNYWYNGDYIGIGTGAHGRFNDYMGRRATMMIHSPEKWLEACLNKGCGIQNDTILNNNEILKEILLLGLRIPQGININRAKDMIGVDILNIVNKKSVNLLKDNNLLEITNNSINLTYRGRKLLNSVVAMLLKNIDY